MCTLRVIILINDRDISTKFSTAGDLFLPGTTLQNTFKTRDYESK